MARWVPTRALRREDFPTLGAPARAMWPVRGMGKTRRLGGRVARWWRRGEGWRAGVSKAEDPVGRRPGGVFKGKAGDGLLSHHLAMAVPSALQGLTTVFGMGTGVAPAR